MDKYNYIILGSDWDLYLFSYSDIFDFPNVRYISSPFPTPKTFKRLLYRLHFSPLINKFVNIPGKGLWNNTYFRSDFTVEKQLCIIMFSNWFEMENGIVDYIRSKYKDARIVCIVNDLIKTRKFRFSKTTLNPSFLNKEFDLVLSFDQGDCEKYGYVYHPLVFSEYKGKKENLPQSDVYMLARAKNRLREIYDVYDKLTDTGLNVNLLLSGVDEKDRRKDSEIRYVEGKGISYEENLQHILNTKCILEVMQTGGKGYTQRGCEAVCLGKKMLTNNPLIKQAPFYNPAFISTFHNAQDLDMDFLRRIKSENEVADYHYKERMSPVELLNFIEKRI